MERKSQKDHVPTSEEIWKILRETEQIVRENAISLKETERIIKESQQKTDLMIKRMQQEIGGISKSNGEFAEEYFYNTYDNGEPLEFAGERFDEIERNDEPYDPRIDRRDEYDLVLRNGSKIAIIETKYKSRESNIEDVIKKADSYRFWYPQYKNHKIYLGLAALTFDRNTIDKARKKGIAIIRQRGGKTVVYDKGLKAY